MLICGKRHSLIFCSPPGVHGNLVRFHVLIVQEGVVFVGIFGGVITVGLRESGRIESAP